MSRIGKQNIMVPPKTSVAMNDGKVTVKGPLGEISRQLSERILVVSENDHVTLAPREQDTESLKLWGTYASEIVSMIEGVNKEFQKKLIVEGIGFKSEVKGSDLVMSLGFSHQVTLKIPQGLKVTAEKNIITVSGIDKELVGQFVAKVRAQKLPEPYKGKGIRGFDEVIRRKQGKKAA
ncbi:MAG: 50S ribosomal protein L6 [Candidatus Taylorbacteria bacterium]